MYRRRSFCARIDDFRQCSCSKNTLVTPRENVFVVERKKTHNVVTETVNIYTATYVPKTFIVVRCRNAIYTTYYIDTRYWKGKHVTSVIWFTHFIDRTCVNIIDKSFLNREVACFHFSFTTLETQRKMFRVNSFLKEKKTSW